jgi:regulatory protein
MTDPHVDGDGPTDPAVSVPDADPESVARAIVLRRLTAAPQTRAQLAQALARRNVPDDVAAAVLDRMTEVGLVDDAAYAREYVRVRRAARGVSRRSLGVELRRKGVADALIEESLADLDAEDDRLLAKDLVERKWSSVTRLDRDAARRRLVGMLGRRGFAPGLAFAVVREVEQERGWVGSAADDLVAADLIGAGDEV